MRLLPATLTVLACSVLGTAHAQHARVSAVAVHPSNPHEVWVCNRDNNSVSVVDAAAGIATHEIAVGQRPRSLAFSADGARVFVANQRGNVPFDRNFLGFNGSEVRGTVSVIDVASKSIRATLDVGTEPYGVAVAPNGKYFAVSGFRSATLHFFDAQTLAPVATLAYLADPNFIPAPFTIADVDENRDGVADLGEPRGFVIRADSARMYVTHHRSPYVSVVDVALDGSGLPTAASVAAKIDTNTYPFHPIYNPVPVQTIASQGVPRFLEDIDLSPDGTRALVPHLLHNVNHDVNHDFGPGFPGDFANRVYPALTMLDAVANSFAQPGDGSLRLHNELSAPLEPAEYASYGPAAATAVGRATLGGLGEPVLGGLLQLRVEGLAPGDGAMLVLGDEAVGQAGPFGTPLVTRRFLFAVPPGGLFTKAIPNVPALAGQVINAQAVIVGPTGVTKHLTNGVRIRLAPAGVGQDTMGRRAGHPSRVAYNSAGDRVLMLNRGSEDVFLYEVAGGTGSSLRLMGVYPPRLGFVERAALDTSTPMGDLPLGMAVVDDPATSNDDALVYVIQEVTRTLSVLRVDWRNGAILQERPQIPTLLTPDIFNVSQRLGDELFEDASRAQTTGAAASVGEFNNSCASCHFEGGEDANVWQRPAGPRSTMPVYQGSLLTGLILWKGVRLNMGETGPMFGGENGGHGLLSDIEQQALIDAHEVMPVPLNPYWDTATGGLTAQAALGKDLFFGTDLTGLNPTLRRAGCADCHPQADFATGAPRGFTVDFLDPTLTSGENLEWFDPFCFSLQGNIVALNIRNVNSGVNIDFDGDGFPDLDRNSDGYPDPETYTPMNTDKNDHFQRDDPNSYLCPLDPQDPNGPKKTFLRGMREFSIPTKLGVFSSAPYFHDHSAISLRAVVDPEAQTMDPVYGDPAYGPALQGPGLLKFFNEFHDVRGHEQFHQGASKVQLNLQSTNVQADIEAILAFIQSI